MLTLANMRHLEDLSEFLGVSKLQLMENAGRSVAYELAQRFTLQGKKILVVCYHGNNGGDGFVAARYLRDAGFSVDVLFIGQKKKLKEEALVNYSKIKSMKANYKNIDFSSYDLIIDALLGTGFCGGMLPNLADAITSINNSPAKKICVDVPSGVLAETGKHGLYVHPSLLITFHDVKTGLVAWKKRTVVVDIGIPKQAEDILTKNNITKKILSAVIKNRLPESHKGQFGRVLVVAGCVDYVGAASLCAQAALATLRSGVDIVTVAAPEKVAWAINCLTPDIITKKLTGNFFVPKHLKNVLALAAKHDVVLIGPGMGLEKQTVLFVQHLVKELTAQKKPMVIDADALKAIILQEVDNAILTPHKKELDILLQNCRLTRMNIRKDLQENVLLVKGATDYIITKNDIHYNTTGNPGMTVGGTGDVLAGLCAGFLAQSKLPKESACAAAYLNGTVGDALLKEKGYGFVASDFVDMIPKIIKKQLD
ncbi:NAD(P)H-hydrate dehydratase [Candidatus Woesearchaeota archaeon]|nr:NAD(P)H-hydrate dehydratase [Candidatus Woesearchaeota archaeon]